MHSSIHFGSFSFFICIIFSFVYSQTMYSSIGAGNSSDVSPSTYQRSPSLLDLGMYLSEVSRTRWLTAKEIYLLLTFPSSALGIPSLQSPPPVIQGTISL